ncbi:hypothetical protein ASA1KI_18010 [Opitutales bacterium ASA1]|nr:hypothetical protein ASA1KI_18010 [Opitutales bacterium ASA1]
MVSERAYEGGAHWLLFLFDCLEPVDALPAPIHEGSFAFFDRAAVETLPIPATDRVGLWPLFDRHRHGFVALRADCTPGVPLQLVVEQTLPSPPSGDQRRVST